MVTAISLPPGLARSFVTIASDGGNVGETAHLLLLGYQGEEGADGYEDQVEVPPHLTRDGVFVIDAFVPPVRGTTLTTRRPSALRIVHRSARTEQYVM